MIRRTFDPSLLNRVVNHPEVHPWLGVEGEIDLTASITNPDNYALVTEGGGFLLICHEPGVYQVHSQFLPEHRLHTLEAMRAGFDYMFTRTDCHTIQTQVPDSNKAAAALAKRAHFRPLFRNVHPRVGPTTYMTRTIEEWAQQTPSLEADSEWFHNQLSAAIHAARPELPDHTEDKSHDRVVGAAVRMIRAGQTAKAVAFYNRWARLADYTPSLLISETPPVINMSEHGLSCIVGLAGDKLEILLCQ